MKKRLISSLFMLPLLILLVVRNIPLYIGGAILMSIAMYEFYQAFKKVDITPINELGFAYIIFIMFGNIFRIREEVYPFFLYTLFIISIFYVLFKKKKVIDVSITFSGILYIGYCLNSIIMITDRIENGYIFVWLVFIISFATDIFAYLVGKNFGKTKLIPSVSPKKTVEGSLGGIFASVVFGLLFGFIFKLPLGIIFVISLLGSFVAQLGDLAASSIKRYVGIKDFGKIIPGHGGVLDRFDSVLMVAPFVYLVLVFFMN